MDLSIPSPSLLSPIGITKRQLSIAEASSRKACLTKSSFRIQILSPFGGNQPNLRIGLNRNGSGYFCCWISRWISLTFQVIVVSPQNNGSGHSKPSLLKPVGLPDRAVNPVGPEAVPNSLPHKVPASDLDSGPPLVVITGICVQLP